MAVQLAEALAEWSHARMCKELDYGDLEPDNIRAVLNDYPIKLIVILDTTNDHYLLFRTGWDHNRRIHACIFHFDIKDGKIWIQENNTDLEIDRDFEAMGISKKELVIGFHHPSMRECSEYAIV